MTAPMLDCPVGADDSAANHVAPTDTQVSAVHGNLLFIIEIGRAFRLAYPLHKPGPGMYPASRARWVVVKRKTESSVMTMRLEKSNAGQDR